MTNQLPALNEVNFLTSFIVAYVSGCGDSFILFFFVFDVHSVLIDSFEEAE